MRLYILLFIGILLANTTFAQRKWQKTIGLEFQFAGVSNIKKYENFISTDVKNRIPPSPYIMIGRTIGKRFAVHTGVQYQQFSNTTVTKFTYANNIEISNLAFKFHYINIPLMISYKLWNQNKNDIQIGLGVIGKIPIGTQFTNEGGNWSGAISNDPMYAPKLTMDGKVTIQYAYHLNSNNSIGINLFAASGLSNFMSNMYTGPGALQYSESKINYYGIGIQYRF